VFFKLMPFQAMVELEEEFWQRLAFSNLPDEGSERSAK
jgi:hypothetical protein